ncbi:hypothetical protein GUITHDRAFT_109038 [Guillardia theta CCMP2712]|uniref:Uncharacterized protein n=1 Tax=Guillardia theta (strain CCMP2712) TaxID=905079 RepID=L1J9J4_GUITC|nr:hypothetical protein GUITHDRAFT_109038 [Guillardia theta CCMP2712]EKX44992.1 hypothetical protein GUITHDRAFT_109038 [Guillardia theta CCMP2712]|eukprot:XP_005831972.1 hypothetical protein GUITHDRAFT_109038 [Guillardia theta CCMP2712]
MWMNVSREAMLALDEMITDGLVFKVRSMIGIGMEPAVLLQITPDGEDLVATFPKEDHVAIDRFLSRNSGNGICETSNVTKIVDINYVTRFPMMSCLAAS